jgi:hypothetical protein
MFELTFVQKLMLLGLGSTYLWFFMWIWRSSSTIYRDKGKGWGFNLKRKKESPSQLGYTPTEGYFDQIQKTKKRFGGSWFNRK